MFEHLINDLVRMAHWSEASVHPEGLDACVGPFTLHIRQRDGLLTVFIPLGGVVPCALADFSDWPVLNLSSLTEQGDSLLWAREWVERLDGAGLSTLVERLLSQAYTLHSGRMAATGLA